MPWPTSLVVKNGSKARSSTSTATPRSASSVAQARPDPEADPTGQGLHPFIQTAAVAGLGGRQAVPQHHPVDGHAIGLGGCLGGVRRRIADEVIKRTQCCSGSRSHGDDDLLERHGSGVTGGIDAGQGSGALGVDLDLAEAGQRHLAPLEELGVRHQSDLDEDASHRQVFDLTGGAIFVIHADHLAAVTDHFRGAGAHDDVDVAHGAGFLLQHFVGAQGIGKFHHCDVLDDAGEIDGRFYA